MYGGQPRNLWEDFSQLRTILNFCAPGQTQKLKAKLEYLFRLLVGPYNFLKKECDPHKNCLNALPFVAGVGGE